MLLELATAEATWLAVVVPEIQARGRDSFWACFFSAGRAAAFTNAWRRADTVAAGVPGGAAKSSDRLASALASLRALVWPADTETWDSSESRVGTPARAFCQVGRSTVPVTSNGLAWLPEISGYRVDMASKIVLPSLARKPCLSAVVDSNPVSSLWLMPNAPNTTRFSMSPMPLRMSSTATGSDECTSEVKVPAEVPDWVTKAFGNTAGWPM